MSERSGIALEQHCIGIHRDFLKWQRTIKRSTLDAELAKAMKKLAKDKMLRALSNVAYAKGDYEKEMEQAALKKEAKLRTK